MRDTFSTYHPIVNMIFFLFVTGFAMFLRQPVCFGIAILAAGLYGIGLQERSWKQWLYMIPMAVLIIGINPLVNHQGITILGYFPNGNPFTRESIVYGIVAAEMLIAVMLWFSCFHQIFTSDKWLYLFGRILPALSLVLSMILRFVPRYVKQFQAVAEAQRQMGKSMKTGSLRSRMHTGIRILSIMMTWAMENGIETANSMKGRGYGLPGRTAFSLYRWTKRDSVLLGVIFLLGSLVFIGVIQGKFYWTCFPMIISAEVDGWTIGAYIVYGLLELVPVAVAEIDCLQTNRIRKAVIQEQKLCNGKYGGNT